MHNHVAQGDTDKGVLGTIVSKPLLPYKRSSKAHKEHSKPQFLIYSYKKKNFRNPLPPHTRYYKCW